jgi:hypothetical protein
MHVIGVAEPDILNNDAEMQSARRYLAHEQKVCDEMETEGKTLMELGIWAYDGLRRRVMVYICSLALGLRVREANILRSSLKPSHRCHITKFPPCVGGLFQDPGPASCWLVFPPS